MNAELKVSELMICKFECDYPVLNVRQEIVKMQNWWLANPKRRKSNEYRFVVGWLNREHARVVAAEVKAREGYRGSLTGSGHREPTPEQAEYNRRILEGAK